MRILIMGATGFGLLLSAQALLAQEQPIDKIRDAMESSMRENQQPGGFSRFAADFARAAVASTPAYSTSSNDAIPSNPEQNSLYAVKALRQNDWAQ